MVFSYYRAMFNRGQLYLQDNFDVTGREGFALYRNTILNETVSRSF